MPDSSYTVAMLGIDTMLVLDDLTKFIDFSEQNIQWQRKRELQRLERDGDVKSLDEPDRASILLKSQREEVLRRFDDLLQRVRYASLIALITTVERVAVRFKRAAESMDRSIPLKPNGKNETVHLLDVFNQVGLGTRQHAELLETLTQTRNCIVHAAGLVDEYKHGGKLRSSLTKFEGVKISYHEFWGQDVIEIEDHFLQRLIEDTKAWLLKFY